MKDQIKDPKNISPYAILVSFLVAAFLVFPELEPYQDVIVLAVLTIAPIVVIWLERQKVKHEELARLDDTVEAHIIKLTEAIQYLRSIKDDLPIYNALPARHRLAIDMIEDRIANLTTKIQGFRDFDEIRKDLVHRRDEDGESDRLEAPPEPDKQG